MRSFYYSYESLTGMPHILNPNVGTGSKKQPMDRYKEETNHIAGQCNANEEYWECLKIEQYY